MSRGMVKNLCGVLAIGFFLVIGIDVALGAEISSVRVYVDDRRVRFGDFTNPIGPRDVIEVVVKIKGKNEEVYLGATIYVESPEEYWQDIRVAPVTFGRFRSTEEENVICRVNREYFPNVPGVMKLIVALWEEKTSCPRRNQCIWCERNGYHMEGQIESMDPEVIGMYFPPISD